MVFPKKIVTPIRMLYINMKAMVCSPDGDTDFFNIFTEGEILASYMFILCLNNVLWTSIDLINENGFTLKKARSR